MLHSMLDSFHLLDPRRKLKAAFLHVRDEALKNISIRYNSNFSFEKNSAFSPKSVTRKFYLKGLLRQFCGFNLIGQIHEPVSNYLFLITLEKLS